MTRLFFLAACFAGALATYDNYGGGDKMSSEASGGYMNSGDKSADNMKSGDMSQSKDMKAGSGAAAAGASITVLTSCKGGSAPVEQMAQPSMAKGMMHKASTHKIRRLSLYSSMLRPSLQVTVGGDAGLVFSPNTLSAMPGDMVEFTFMSMNHTLTQSTFPEPCKKMKDGADSGFLPNPNNTISPPPTYMFQVMDTKPVWFYCKQKKPTSHCGKGMTFSINPTADKTNDMFTAMAIQQNGTAAAPAGMSSSMAPPADTTMMVPPMDTTMMAPPAAAYTPPPPAPAAAAMPAAAAAAGSPPATPPQAPAMLSAPAAAVGNNMAAGAGTMQNGQCSCSCLCGVSAFPAGAGVGMVGGWSGSVSM
ncbi:MAG: hypothetical protein Q9168_006457 [Polycauliona sp. 1 TL-2023]